MADLLVTIDVSIGHVTSHTRRGWIVCFQKIGFEKLLELKSEFKNILEVV